MEMRSKSLQAVLAWTIVFVLVPAFAQKDPGVRAGSKTLVGDYSNREFRSRIRR